MARLEVTSLGVHLCGKQILTNVEVNFEPGLIHGILGRNGSGKTTLLRALCNAVPITSGRVLLDGRPIAAMRASTVARQLAVVWQNAQIGPELTVRRMVGYGRFVHQKWWQVRSSGDEAAIDRALQYTHLTSLAQRQVGTLSGGEMQRAWLATALAQEPEILLLDEPTTYLDVAHQLDILELVSDLNRDRGLTVIMVLHDLTQAARYCDQCIVLDHGEASALAPPDESLDADSVRTNFDVEAWLTTDPDGRRVIQPRHRLSGCHARRADAGDLAGAEAGGHS